MKKVFMAAVFAVLSSTAVMAQSAAGSVFVKPMVGATLTTLTKADDSKMKFGLVGGAEVGYQVSDAFAVTGGVLASMQGAKMKDYSEVVAGETYSVKDASTSLTYLNIPILANYYIVPGLSIKAGIQPGFLLSHKSKATEVTPAGEFKEEETSTSGLKKFDFSIPLGLSYEFSDFVIDARYNLGLTKISKSDINKSKNSVIMLTVGYKIPLN